MNIKCDRLNSKEIKNKTYEQCFQTSLVKLHNTVEEYPWFIKVNEFRLLKIYPTSVTLLKNFLGIHKLNKLIIPLTENTTKLCTSNSTLFIFYGNYGFT